MCVNQQSVSLYVYKRVCVYVSSYFCIDWNVFHIFIMYRHFSVFAILRMSIIVHA